jgi:phosphate transport system permease protein
MSETLSCPTPIDAPFILTARRRKLNGDKLLHAASLTGAIAVLLMLATLLGVLFHASLPAVKMFGISFFTTTEWRPNEIERPKKGADGKIVMEDGEIVMETLPPVFGALPVIYGTAVSSTLAIVFAVPLSFGAAIFLVRIAPAMVAPVVSFLIEFLAAIPSIAYGFWGLFVLVPFMQKYVEPAFNAILRKIPGLSVIATDGSLTGRDMFVGGVVLGIMIVPIITAISRDVLRQVPRAQIEGTIALGATWWQSAKEMLLYSRSALFGAVMLGLARAAGETMAVAMVIGNNNQIKSSLFEPAQTMSSLLANEFAEANSELHRGALVEVALILLLMSLLFNVVARYLVVGKNARTAAAH